MQNKSTIAIFLDYIGEVLKAARYERLLLFDYRNFDMPNAQGIRYALVYASLSICCAENE